MILTQKLTGAFMHLSSQSVFVMRNVKFVEGLYGISSCNQKDPDDTWDVLLGDDVCILLLTTQEASQQPLAMATSTAAPTPGTVADQTSPKIVAEEPAWFPTSSIPDSSAALLRPATSPPQSALADSSPPPCATLLLSPSPTQVPFLQQLSPVLLASRSGCPPFWWDQYYVGTAVMQHILECDEAEMIDFEGAPLTFD
jgi:hypothetical protein